MGCDSAAQSGAQPVMSAIPRAPASLSEAARAIWRGLNAEYELSPSDLRVLREGLAAWDRSAEAAAIIDQEGLTFIDPRGVPRQHPAAGLELRHRDAYLKALRDLRLDGSALPDPRPRRAS
jgi:phage terminase small subunit